MTVVSSCGAGHTADIWFSYTHETFPGETLTALIYVCLFVLCRPVAPNESNNVIQSNETENDML